MCSMAKELYLELLKFLKLGTSRLEENELEPKRQLRFLKQDVTGLLDRH